MKEQFALGFGITAATGAGLVLLVKLYPTFGFFALGVLGATLFFTALALAHRLGERSTAQKYEQAGNLILRSQELNDRWDAAKTTAFAGLIREVFRLKSESQETPALPWEVGQDSIPSEWPPVMEKYAELTDGEGEG